MDPIQKLKQKIDNLEIYEGNSSDCNCHEDSIRYKDCMNFSKQLETKQNVKR